MKATSVLPIALCTGALMLGFSAVLPPTKAIAASPSPSPTPDAATKLVIETENPLSYLLKLPFQDNFNFNDGVYRLMQQQLKIEPVVPTPLGNGGLFVSRFVLPVESVPPAKTTEPWTAGLGDLNPQFYYTPRAGNVMFGYGPTFSLPTGSNQYLGNGKWCAGADAAFVDKQPQSIFYVLAYNYWSFAGNAWKKTVDSGNIQPTMTWTLPHGVGIGLQSNTTVDWTKPGDNKWTVPFGPTWSQILGAGHSNVQIAGGFFWNVVHPVNGGSTWSARAELTLVYPQH